MILWGSVGGSRPRCSLCAINQGSFEKKGQVLNLPLLLPGFDKHYDKICKYHQCVDDVKDNNPIPAVQNFVNDPAYISKENKQQEQAAFPFNGIGPEGLYYGYRPADTESENHEGFKHAHCVSVGNLYFLSFSIFRSSTSNTSTESGPIF